MVADPRCTNFVASWRSRFVSPSSASSSASSTALFCSAPITVPSRGATLNRCSAADATMATITTHAKRRHIACSVGFASLKGCSGNFVNRHLVGNAPQRRALGHRFEAAGLQQHRCLRVLYHRAGRVDRARDREILHARGDIHGLTEIVAALVERDGKTRPLMKADLEQQVLARAPFM